MTENGYEYVDLGLPSKTMWATCNVGASKPEDEGLLFQFGRVDGYKYGDKNHKFRIENLTTASGKLYDKNEILDVKDDAAHVHMGGKWMMPTNDQLEELFNNTTYWVETINGVECMMFTSVINGNKLFIPFAGYWHNDTYYHVKSIVGMWSSQVINSSINYAYRLYCNNSSGHVFIIVRNRYSALSVRGVFKKQQYNLKGQKSHKYKYNVI